MPKHELVSPVDLPPGEDSHPLRWTATVIAVATLLLGLFNAEALRNWAHGLPVTPLDARIVAATEGWYGFTDSLGLTRPGQMIRAAYDEVKAARFDGSESPPSDQ